MIAVSIESLNFSYSHNVPIIINANYSFSKNSIYSISGPNGAGKTTLLRLMCRFIKPNSGAVSISPNNSIGYLPDKNGIYEELTINENIEFRLALYNLSYKKQLPQIEMLLDRFNLTQNQNNYVKQLSLGMKKKAALIATFAADPQIIILDEPTSGIDDSSKSRLIEFLIDNSKNRTIICTSHDKDITNNNTFHHLYLSKGELTE